MSDTSENGDSRPAGGGTQPVPLDREIRHYKAGVLDLYVHDWAEGTQLYKRAGEAMEAAEAAAHDGPAIRDGHFRRFDQDGLVTEYHPQAGYRDAHAPGDEFDEPVILLREVRRVA